MPRFLPAASSPSAIDAGPQPAVQGPVDEALHARDALLATLDVQFDGVDYRYHDRHFERFTDALSHARHAAADGDFEPASTWPSAAERSR